MSGDYLIAFLRGVRPVLCRRVLWYADPAFGTAATPPSPWWWLALAVCLAAIAVAVFGR